MSRTIYAAIAIAIALSAVLYLTLEGEEAGAPIVVSGDAPAGSAIVQVSVPEELPDIALIGQRGFEAKCIACHGVNAAGVEGAGPPLVHKIYEPSHHGDAAFWLATQNGVRSHHWDFGNMPPVEGLTKSDVDAIVAYVRTLQTANGIQ